MFLQTYIQFCAYINPAPPYSSARKQSNKLEHNILQTNTFQRQCRTPSEMHEITIIKI